MKRPEVVYVRSGYVPLRTPKVPPTPKGVRKGHFFSRARLMIAEMEKARKRVDMCLHHVRLRFSGKHHDLITNMVKASENTATVIKIARLEIINSRMQDQV